MTSRELRQAFIDFFISRGHKQIPPASLIPENDPSVLFTTAGMQPLVPYLLGQPHPMGRRLVDFQKCVRTVDIDDVGDPRHLTFFEMLGNWSLGDYFKQESIAMSHEFLTRILKIPQETIAVTVFEGDENAPRDIESAEIWESLGYPKDRIFFLSKDDNWWEQAGAETGPCGPDTEIFVDNGAPACGPECKPGCGCGKYTEIWNNVFMQYNKIRGGKLEPLASQCVDTGMGLERTVRMLAGLPTVFETDLFMPIIGKISELTGKKYDDQNLKAFRVASDHLRTSTFILGDDKGIEPSNADQGYVLRRLIRRAYRYLSHLGAPKGAMSQVARVVVDEYDDIYPELSRNQDFVYAHLDREEELFGRTLEQGMRIAKKCIDAGALSAENAFELYATYGFPLEFTQELAHDAGLTVDADGYKRLFAEHQALSRAGAEQKFKGGLADNSVETTRLHTATHLLHGALRRILGESVFQRGANITAERTRLDFSFDRKLTPGELARIEATVNQAIDEKIPVIRQTMPLAAARESGAVGIFDDKYGTDVTVYDIAGYDRQICGGPHVENTGELGRFKIIKEESSSAGVRRIKAVLS